MTDATPGPDHSAEVTYPVAELGTVEDTSKFLSLTQRRVVYLVAGPVGASAGAVAATAAAAPGVVAPLVGLVAGAVAAACTFLITGLALGNPSR